MKTRLPKTLLVALMAAASYSAQAGYITIGGVIGVDPLTGNPITATIKPSDTCIITGYI
ncbi:MAG: hypothetical protein IJB33_07900 [Akkermansia sp.]|nr:hypothetical protein [Akkermansia sp.]